MDRKRTTKNQKKKNPNKFRKVNQMWRTELEQTTRLPSKTKKCLNGGKIGHYAKLCRSKQRTDRKMNISGIWSNQRRRRLVIKQNTLFNKNGPFNKTNTQWQPFFLITALFNDRPIKFIICSGPPVTLIPKQMFNWTTPMRPLQTEYRDANNNKIKFKGKTMSNVKRDGETKSLELFVTTKSTNPSLGLDWMKQLRINLQTEKN